MVIRDPKLHGLAVMVEPVACPFAKNDIRRWNDPGNVYGAFEDEGKVLTLPVSGCFGFKITVTPDDETEADAVGIKMTCANGVGEKSPMVWVRVGQTYFMYRNAKSEDDNDSLKEFVALSPEQAGVEAGSKENLCKIEVCAVILDEPLFQSKGTTRSATRSAGNKRGRNAIVQSGNKTINNFQEKNAYDDLGNMVVKKPFRIKFQTEVSYEKKEDDMDEDVPFEEDEEIDHSIHFEKEVGKSKINFKIKITKSVESWGMGTLVTEKNYNSLTSTYTFKFNREVYVRAAIKQEQKDKTQQFIMQYVNNKNESDESDFTVMSVSSKDDFNEFKWPLQYAKEDSGEGWLIKTLCGVEILKIVYEYV